MMANSSEDRTSDNLSVAPRRLPTSSQVPPTFGVRLIFAGLMGFCYNPVTKKCEVGFYTRDGQHQPAIMVYEKPGCHGTPVTPGTGRMKIGITNQPSTVVSYN